MSFCRENLSATALSGILALNKPNKSSQKWKEKDNTLFNNHLISASVTQSDIIYESSVDILLELSGVWISGEGGGGWGLEIRVNEIL